MPVNFEFKRLFLLTTGFCSTYNNIEGQVKGEIGKNDHVPFFFFRVLSIYPISNKRQKSTSIFFLPHFFSILRGQNNSFLLKRNVLNSDRERESIKRDVKDLCRRNRRLSDCEREAEMELLMRLTKAEKRPF